jgi:hypothetical protein
MLAAPLVVALAGQRRVRLRGLAALVLSKQHRQLLNAAHVDIRYLLKSAVCRQRAPQLMGSSPTSCCSWRAISAASSVVESTTASKPSMSCGARGCSFASVSACSVMSAAALHLVQRHSNTEAVVQLLMVHGQHLHPAVGAAEAFGPTCRSSSTRGTSLPSWPPHGCPGTLLS